jgi:uncharacterized RDD family membrane protein YckC
VYPDGHLTIETPEQITMELAPAGIGSRFLALALDTVIQAVLYIAAILLFVAVAWMSPTVRMHWLPTQWHAAITLFLLFCIYWCYFAAFEVLWHGQTPGKRVVGIRVVKDSGRPITAVEGIGRNLMRAVDGFFFYLIGVLSIAISHQNKRLGDYVAGTVVVHEKNTSEIKPDWSFDRAPEATFTPELSNISEQDLMLIETFLHRRFDLDPIVRLSTGVRLAEVIQRKSGLTRPTGESEEDFLQSVARQARDQARLRK